MKSPSVAIQKLPNISLHEDNLDLNPKYSDLKKKSVERISHLFSVHWSLQSRNW